MLGKGGIRNWTHSRNLEQRYPNRDDWTTFRDNLGIPTQGVGGPTASHGWKLGMLLNTLHDSPTQVAHSRPSVNISRLNAEERIGLESWATPSKARTRAADLHIFFPLSNVWNKIQMNQLFQGRSFNYIPASFSADKNVNSLLTPGSTAMLPSSAAWRAHFPSVQMGDRCGSISSSQPPGLSPHKEPGSQAEGPSSIESFGSCEYKLKSQLQGISCETLGK